MHPASRSRVSSRFVVARRHVPDHRRRKRRNLCEFRVSRKVDGGRRWPDMSGIVMICGPAAYAPAAAHGQSARGSRRLMWSSYADRCDFPPPPSPRSFVDPSSTDDRSRRYRVARQSVRSGPSTGRSSPALNRVAPAPSENAGARPPGPCRRQWPCVNVESAPPRTPRLRSANQVRREGGAGRRGGLAVAATKPSRNRVFGLIVAIHRCSVTALRSGGNISHFSGGERADERRERKQ